MREIQAKIAALQEAAGKIDNKARRENRNLYEFERQLKSDIEAEIKDLKMQLPQDRLTVQGPNSRMQTGRGRGSSGPCGAFNSAGEFFKAVYEAGVPSGKVDHRLYNAASGLSESVPSDGGFLVESTLSQEIITNAFEYGEIAKICRYQPIGANANGIKINGVDETSRATGSRFGGVRSYWLDEASEKQSSKPKFRQISLELKKNVVLVYATDELLQDATALEAFIRLVAPQEIAFSVQDTIINGTGAGMPLGILNSGCLVTVDKEEGQSPNTIIAENILAMYKRTLGESKNYRWYYNKSCLDQLYALSLSVGTGGVPLFLSGGTIPNQPENRLLGLPLIECEQCSALSSLGDIILADFSNGYILADKGGVQADVSIHVRFVWDESVFRFVYRVDGQPVLASAVTPFKGTDTLSHFIALEAR